MAQLGDTTVFGDLNVTGQIYNSSKIAFDAVYTTPGGAIGYTTANAEIVFNAVNTNIGGGYNSSTGRFTAPISGNYFFSARGMSTSTAWYELKKNGSNLTYPHNPYSTSTASVWVDGTGSWIVYLNAGDYVSLFTGSTGGIYGGGNNHNYFLGFLLG